MSIKIDYFLQRTIITSFPFTPPLTPLRMLTRFWIWKNFRRNTAKHRNVKTLVNVLLIQTNSDTSQVIKFLLCFYFLDVSEALCQYYCFILKISTSFLTRKYFQRLLLPEIGSRISWSSIIIMPAVKPLLLFAIVYLLPTIQCIMFNLNPNQRKCLSEELRQNVLITGDYDVSEHRNQHVNYVVSINEISKFNVSWKILWSSFEMSILFTGNRLQRTYIIPKRRY